MELIRNLSIICLVIIVLLEFNKRPLAEPDLLSGREYQYPKFLVVAFWFAITFVAAFREGFIDTGTYRMLYEGIGSSYADAFDPDFPIQDYGFNLLMVFLNRISSDSQLLIIVTSVITFSIYIYTIVKYTQDLPFSLLLFLCTGIFGSLNGIRQVLAGAILLLGLPLLRDRKIVWYSLLVLLVSTIHASAIIMLPLGFIIAGKRLNWGLWIFAGWIVLSFAAPGFTNAVLGSLLQDSTYEGYLDIDSQMGVMRLLVSAVPAIIAVMYCVIEQNNHRGEDPDCKDYYSQRMTDVLVNMQIISFGLTALGMRMVYFARLSLYFECVLAILLPITLKHTFTRQSARSVKMIAIAMYLFFFIYQIYSYNIQGSLYAFKLIF